MSSKGKRPARIQEAIDDELTYSPLFVNPYERISVHLDHAERLQAIKLARGLPMARVARRSKVEPFQSDGLATEEGG